MGLLEPSLQESGHFQVVETTAPLYQSACECGERGVLGVRRSLMTADRLHVCWGDAFLQRQGAVECNGPRAGVGYRIGQQEDLDLLFGKAASMHFLKQGYQAVDEDRRRGHDARDVGDRTEGSLQRLQGLP